MRRPRGSSKLYPKLCLCECGNLVNTRNTAQALYASNQCQRNYEYRCFIRAWLNGEITGNARSAGRTVSQYVRRYILERDGHKCVLCGWSQKNPFTGTWPLVVDHIDGNSERTIPDNLRTLCPNCDSLTPTYKGANRGRGRAARRKQHLGVK